MQIIKRGLVTTVFLCAAWAAQAQSAADVVQKHINAIGGLKNWEKVSTLKMTGSMSIQGAEILFTQTQVQGKGLRVDISAMGMKGYSILTNKEGWVYMPFQPGMEQVTPLPEDQVMGSQGKLNIKNAYLADTAAMGKVEYLGKDTVNKAVCHKLQLTDRYQNVQTAYIDAANYYLVRTVATIKTPDGDQEMAVNYGNFKKLPEGVVVPHTVSGMMGGDVVYSKIEINKPIPDTVFAPDEVKK